MRALGDRLERLEERVAKRAQAGAVRLDPATAYPAPPTWAERLDDRRVVRVIDADPAERRRVVRRLAKALEKEEPKGERARSLPSVDGVTLLPARAAASRFI